MGVLLLSDARRGRVHLGPPEAIVIRIAITAEAYEAIGATMPLGSVGYEVERGETGKVSVWLDRWAMDRLTAERRRGEDLSDTIIRLAMET